MNSLNRADALALLHEYVKDAALVRHMLAVEAAMRAYARKLGQDEETWGIVGLLHDFDYERWPNAPDHPLQGSAILRRHGYPDDVIHAILSHADYLADRHPRTSPLDKALYACDELAGFVSACSMVRPGGITDLTAASVKKKLKAKGFAQRQPRRHHARRRRFRRRAYRAHPVRHRRDEAARRRPGPAARQRRCGVMPHPFTFSARPQWAAPACGANAASPSAARSTPPPARPGCRRSATSPGRAARRNTTAPARRRLPGT